MTSIKSSVAACFIFSLLMAVSADAATLTVNSIADDGTGTCTATKCTLRDAILSAISGDTVIFSLPALSAITLTNGELLINKNLTINGPGANLLSVLRSRAEGTPSFRIVTIGSSFNVNVFGLTIAYGTAVDGGGIFNGGTLMITNTVISGSSANRGGGIFNNGTLTLTNGTISGNSGNNGVGIYSAGGMVSMTNTTISGNAIGNTGGAIHTAAGVVNIASSTLSGNGANLGGGIFNDAGVTMNINNSTISGNTAISSGGGIDNNSSSTVNLTNSTISGNTATTSGGAIFNSGAIKAKSTIIALNAAANGPDVLGALTSQGFNLIGNNSTATITPTTGDQIGTPASPINPMLGPLQDNGGPTKTHALLPGSTAIEKGDSSGSSTDQRGFPRPVDTPAIVNATGGDGSDIGAYEAQPDQLIGCSEINLVVNNNSDGSGGSLRSVIANACAGSTVTFAANVRGAISLTSGELLVNKNLTINGPGANLLAVRRSSVSSTSNFRIFNVASASVNVTITGLTIANGNVPGQLGGGIYNTGTLTLTNATLSGNSAINGGGIHNDFGTLILRSSTISGNTVSSSTAAGSGGGIFNRGGTVLIGNSTISGNTANGPGGNSDSGGGIITNVGMVSIFNSTISGNSGDIGGGIRNINGGTVTSSNTIIALNTSASGADISGPVTSRGFNLIGNPSGAMITPVLPSDLIGVTTVQLNLGPLQDNGGPTLTHALLSGSFATDKGNSGGSITDQRGLTRPVDLSNRAVPSGGDGSDIGAFEVQALQSAVVEFYNMSLDHYFITWVVDEIAILDAGTLIKGWTRTGQAFKTYTTPQSGTSPVCRYYIPPELGDSHFFGRGTAECDATGQKNPSFVLEDPAFMQMFLPVAGNCPANMTQVYRVFSNRLDANHRYMIDKAIRDQMVAMGWLVEGDGPDAVVMCAPQ